MPPPFLTAAWTNLAVATWEVEPALLKPYIPPTLRLDLRDSMAFVSLVGFQFRDTRVRGMKVPGHVNFDEINLRFYVRKTGYRGVTFIREFVPLPMVSMIAKLSYNEPYVTAPVRGRVACDDMAIVATYELDRGGRTHSFTISGQRPSFRPDNTTLEHFILEQRWGFGRTKRGEMLRYEVEHPPWQIYPVGSYAIDFDFAAVYGPQWDVLSSAEPRSVILCAGSPVKVWPPRRIRLRDEMAEGRRGEPGRPSQPAEGVRVQT